MTGKAKPAISFFCRDFGGNDAAIPQILQRKFAL
jgi:hypothetical protein